MKKRAVLLDRDGVINAMVYDIEHGLIDSPLNPKQVQIFPGVVEAIKRLVEANFLVAIVSNQPAVAKRKMTIQMLRAITNTILETINREKTYIPKVFYCLHHPEASDIKYRCICNCRKPLPGLLLQASKDLNLDLNQSFMVGDGFTDIEAGKAAGCFTVWIGKWKCDTCQMMKAKELQPDFIARDLLSAAKLIISRKKGGL